MDCLSRVGRRAARLLVLIGGVTVLAAGVSAAPGDTDDDGLKNSVENEIGTDLRDADSDDDGVPDGAEPDPGGDFDQDGLINALDPDADNDGVPDGTEAGVTAPGRDTDLSAEVFRADKDPMVTSSPVSRDTDDGGVEDGVEDRNRDGAIDPAETNPADPSDDYADQDGDTIIDTTEGAGDSDQDGIPDYLDDDADNDGLPDRDEAGDDDVTTPPVDTDGDGMPDFLDPDSDDDAEPDQDDGCPTLPGPCTPVDPGPDPDPDPSPDPTAPSDDFGIELGGGCQLGGGGDPRGALGAASLLLLLAWRRSRRSGAQPSGRGMRRVAGAVALGTVALTPTAAAADSGAFTIDRFRLSADPRGILDVESGDVPSHLSWGVGMWFGHLSEPLVAYRRDTGESIGAIVERRFSGELSGWLALGDRLELQAVLPVVISQAGDSSLDGVDMPLPPLDGAGMGQLRLVPKLLVAGDSRRAISLLAGLSLPTGTNDSYVGQDRFVFSPEAAASLRHGRARFAANLGLTLPIGVAKEVMGVTISDEVFVRVGAAVALGHDHRAELAASLSGATLITDAFARHQSSLEATFGPSLQLNESIGVFAAGGVGLSHGFGTPDWRAIAGLRLQSAPPSRGAPHSGVTARAGQPSLPDAPAPAPAPASGDDANVGRTDIATHAPSGATAPGQQDAPGTTDTPVPRAGVEIPAASSTGDGDRDRDGLDDRLDTCPSEAGPEANHGCAQPPPAYIVGDRVIVTGRVAFESGDAALTPDSRTALDALAELLARHPEMRLRIEGHTDNLGAQEYNLDLSQRRAQRVQLYLLERGIHRDRLSPTGHGSARPRYDNATRVGRAANRRVEFVIVYE